MAKLDFRHIEGIDDGTNKRLKRIFNDYGFRKEIGREIGKIPRKINQKHIENFILKGKLTPEHVENDPQLFKTLSRHYEKETETAGVEQETEKYERRKIKEEEKLTKKQEKLAEAQKKATKSTQNYGKPFREPSGSWGLLFFLSLILWGFDYLLTKFNGIDIETFFRVASQQSTAYLLMVILNVFVLIAVAVYLFITGFDFKNKLLEYASYTLFILTLSAMFFISRDFLKSPQNYGAFFHLVFAVFVLITLKNTSTMGRERIYRTFIVFIIIDFFLYSILLIFIGGAWSSRKLFITPFWVLYTLYNWNKTSEKKRLANFCVILVIGLLIASNAHAINELLKTSYVPGDVSQKEGLTSPAEFAKEGFRSILGTFKDLVERGEKYLNESYYYDSKDYYTGKVDKNVEEPLGVYITDIETLDHVVYEDEPIEIWATLIAKSIEESIDYIKIDCEADILKPTPIKGKSKITEFRNFIDEEEDIDCKFEEGELELGSHLVTFTAEFDFSTLAYLKTYFIDDERLKAMRREDIDVFNEYGIEDREPITIHTNGPVGIGMETKTPPIGVSEGYDDTPAFGITIENKWIGKITKIKDLIIYLPEGIELDDYCDGAFQDLTREKYKLEGYNGYEFTEGIKGYKEWKNIDDYRSRKCRLSIKDPKKILGDMPISIKYIKARIDYIYKSEESFNLNVESPKGFNVYFNPKKPTIKDDIDCIASHSNYYIKRAPFYIYKLENNEWKEIFHETVECNSKKYKCNYPIPKGLFNKGDEIKCKVVKAELSNEGEETDSATVIIQNSAPTIDVDFEPNPPIEGSDLKCIGLIEDYDKEDTNFNIMYEVKKNNERINYEGYEVLKDEDNKKFQILIKKENLNENDKIYCKMIAKDIVDIGESKESESDEITAVVKKSSSGIIADCTGKSDGTACKDTVHQCWQGECITSCEYLAKTYPSVGTEWSCLCKKEDWIGKCNPSNNCIPDHCPEGLYCCHPDAVPP